MARHFTPSINLQKQRYTTDISTPGKLAAKLMDVFYHQVEHALSLSVSVMISSLTSSMPQ